VLRLAGPDSRRFLQGQISNDVQLLAADADLLAGLHTPQGRVVALLRLLADGDQDVLLVLPRALVAAVAARLGRYILRAKVQIEDLSSSHDVFGLTGQGRRYSCVLAVGADPPPGLAVDAGDWQAADLAAGLPQVYPVTSERFVAQMLNLDRVGAVSFTKGCYTGQEIVARAHYRGRVKRRMQRFATEETAILRPGDRRLLPDGRVIDVVDVVSRAMGGYEVLAVAAQEAASAGAGPDEPATATSDALPLQARSLPLPYTLED
jgi:folate-binding protein YgfZ